MFFQRKSMCFLSERPSVFRESVCFPFQFLSIFPKYLRYLRKKFWEQLFPPLRTIGIKKRALSESVFSLSEKERTFSEKVHALPFGKRPCALLFQYSNIPTHFCGEFIFLRYLGILGIPKIPKYLAFKIRWPGGCGLLDYWTNGKFTKKTFFTILNNFFTYSNYRLPFLSNL